jgi:hypothetical protein
MKVICDWMTCKHNTSRGCGVAGECKADNIELKDIEEVEDLEGYDIEVYDIGLVCIKYEYDKEKAIKTVENAQKSSFQF